MVSFGFLPLSNNKFVLATVSAVAKRKKMMFMINLANNSNNKNTNNVDLTTLPLCNEANNNNPNYTAAFYLRATSSITLSYTSDTIENAQQWLWN